MKAALIRNPIVVMGLAILIHCSQLAAHERVEISHRQLGIVNGICATTLNGQPIPMRATLSPPNPVPCIAATMFNGQWKPTGPCSSA
jgi:hypothetical protein